MPKTRDLKQFDQTILLQYIRSESAYDGKENELLERIADHVEEVKDDTKEEMARLWGTCVQEAREDYPRGCSIDQCKLMNFATHKFNEKLNN